MNSKHKAIISVEAFAEKTLKGCKFCGIHKTGHSLRCHEACCPEMKRIADFALDNCFIAPQTKVFKKEAVVFGVETVDEKIIAIVKRYKK